jgi:hypothetical protein
VISPYRSVQIAADAPAEQRDELIEQLVHQFSDPYAFYRELVQNSIDAGSPRVEVTLRYQPAGERGVATACVADWGSGMTRELVEQYLVTKFRSTKEGDRTKIGKFGIGFKSVLAPAPELVVVETGRDGEAWRMLLHPDRTYELLRAGAPLTGTRVLVHKEMGAVAWREFVEKSRDAVRRWCRHTEVEVTFAAGAEDGAPPGAPERVGEPLTVDAPFQIEYREAGLWIVAGPSRRSPAVAGFYNRGLTLLETAEPFVPGVTFKVVSSRLEHTLTRDNVRRDREFLRVLKQVRRLAGGPLRARLCEEIRARAEAPAGAGTPPPSLDDLACLLAHGHERLGAADLRFPLAAGGAIDGRAVRRAGRAAGAVLHAAAGDPLAQALAADGVAVVLAHDGLLAQACEVAGVGRQPAAERWTLCLPAAATPVEQGLADRLGALLAEAGARVRRVVVGTLHGLGAELGMVLADVAGRALPPARALRSPWRRGAPEVLCLNRGHALVAAAFRLAERDLDLAALLCARVMAASWRALDEGADRRLTSSVLSSPAAPPRP